MSDLEDDHARRAVTREVQVMMGPRLFRPLARAVGWVYERLPKPGWQKRIEIAVVLALAIQLAELVLHACEVLAKR